MHCHHEVAAATEGSAFCRFHRKADSSRARPARNDKDIRTSVPAWLIFIPTRLRAKRKMLALQNLTEYFPKRDDRWSCGTVRIMRADVRREPPASAGGATLQRCGKSCNSMIRL